MTSQRAFEAELFAKHHYRKLLTARSSIPQRPATARPAYAPARTLSPLDRFEHRNTNDKICSKLTEIYKCPETALRRYRRSSREREQEKGGRSMNEQAVRAQERSISKSNVQMFERILCAKSSISQDWKARERQLKRYGKLTRKQTKPNITEDCLFQAYQNLLMQSRTTNKKRPSTGRPRKASSAKSRRSEQRERVGDTI